MIGPARKWKERQKQLAERKPRARIDRCEVAQDEKGRYMVVVEGFGLVPAVSPPQITVGGVPLEEIRYEKGGRRLSGVLREPPRDGRVVVDLGYAQATGEAER
jgi:hypothetical protein